MAVTNKGSIMHFTHLKFSHVLKTSTNKLFLIPKSKLNKTISRSMFEMGHAHKLLGALAKNAKNASKF